MGKKELTAEEKLRKAGNEIVGVGIIYLVLFAFNVCMMVTTLLADPVSLIIYGVQIALLIVMVVGAAKKNKVGAIAAWVFEGYLILASILSILLNQGGPDLIALIVMIFLPFEIVKYSKAMKEVESGEVN